MVVEKEGLFGFSRVAPGKFIWPDGSITKSPSQRNHHHLEAVKVLDDDKVQYRANFIGAGSGDPFRQPPSAQSSGYYVDRVFEGEEINSKLAPVVQEHFIDNDGQRVLIRWRP